MIEYTREYFNYNPILEMGDDEVWNTFVKMDVGEFLEFSPSNQSIHEICEDFPYDFNNDELKLTNEEQDYMAECIERVIICEPISTFVKYKIIIRKRRRYK